MKEHSLEEERLASPIDILNRKMNSNGLVSSHSQSDYISRHELIHQSMKKRKKEKPLIFRGNASAPLKNQQIFVLRDSCGISDEPLITSMSPPKHGKEQVISKSINRSLKKLISPEPDLKTEKLHQSQEENHESLPSIYKNYIDFNIWNAADKAKQMMEYKVLRERQRRREDEKKQLTKTILLANDFQVDKKLRNNHNCVIGRASSNMLYVLKKREPNFPLQIASEEKKDFLKEKGGQLMNKEGGVFLGKTQETNIGKTLEEKHMRDVLKNKFEIIERQLLSSSENIDLLGANPQKKKLLLKKVNLVRNTYTHSTHHESSADHNKK